MRLVAVRRVVRREALLRAVAALPLGQIRRTSPTAVPADGVVLNPIDESACSPVSPLAFSVASGPATEPGELRVMSLVPSAAGWRIWPAMPAWRGSSISRRSPGTNPSGSLSGLSTPVSPVIAPPVASPRASGSASGVGR